MIVLGSLSTRFSSVHGERPTAEYAKMRKESLESEFGHALGTYKTKSLSLLYHFGPFLALYRAAIISVHVFKMSIWQFFVHDIKKRAIKVYDSISLHSLFILRLAFIPLSLIYMVCNPMYKLEDRNSVFYLVLRMVEFQNLDFSSTEVCRSRLLVCNLI